MKPEAIEIILNELLEEQRKLATSQSEALAICSELAVQFTALKTPVDTLINSGLTGSVKAIQLSCQVNAEKQSATEKHIQRLEHLVAILQLQNRSALAPFESLMRFFNRWKRWLIATFTIFFFLPLLLFIWQRNRSHLLEPGDAKYQYLKAHLDQSSKLMLNRLDSAYNASPDSFRRAIRLSRSTPITGDSTARKPFRKEETKSIQKKGKAPKT